MALKVGMKKLNMMAFFVQQHPQKLPKSLLAFLKVGCCLVLPVGGSKSQKLKIVTKTKKDFDEQEFENVSFVPMLGGTSK